MISIQTNISPGAKIGTGTSVEPFVTIQSDVVIGQNCWIGPYVTIMNGARIGDNVKIFPGAVVGAAVSYTHLDVYKRQLMFYGKTQNAQWIVVPYNGRLKNGFYIFAV